MLVIAVGLLAASELIDSDIEDLIQSLTYAYMTQIKLCQVIIDKMDPFLRAHNPFAQTIESVVARLLNDESDLVLFL